MSGNSNKDWDYYRELGWKRLSEDLSTQAISEKSIGKSNYKNSLILLLSIGFVMSLSALVSIDKMNLLTMPASNIETKNDMDLSHFLSMQNNLLEFVYSDLESKNINVANGGSIVRGTKSRPSYFVEDGPSDISHPSYEIASLADETYTSKELGAPRIELLSEGNKYDVNYVFSGSDRMKSIPTNKNKLLTISEQSFDEDKFDLGIGLMTGLSNDWQHNALNARVFVDWSVKPRFVLSAGLGYLWTKTDDAIQAVRTQVVGIRDVNNENVEETIEYDTKILVEDLHYVNIPISFNYNLSPKVRAGLGVEGRFLLNNYISDDVDGAYNFRFNAYSLDSGNSKVGSHNYSLRKYALGLNTSLEFEISEGISFLGTYYNGLINISGNKVYNKENNIRNSSCKLGFKYRL